MPPIKSCNTNTLSQIKLLLFATQLFQDGRSPLIAACEGGHTETAQLLIDKGVDVNKTGQVSALILVPTILKHKLEV